MIEWLERELPLVGEVDPHGHRSRLERLHHLGSEPTELPSSRHDVVIRPERRDAGAPLVPLSYKDFRVVDDVSAPAGAGTVLTDQPRPVVVELHGNRNAARLTGLTPRRLQFSGQRGAHPELAQPF